MFTPVQQYYFGFGNNGNPKQQRQQSDIFPSGAPKLSPVGAPQPISNLIALPNK